MYRRSAIASVLVASQLWIASSCNKADVHCENSGKELLDELDFSLGDRCALLLALDSTLEISPRTIRVPPASGDAKGQYVVDITGYIDSPLERETFADGYLVELEITDYSPDDYASLCYENEERTIVDSDNCTDELAAASKEIAERNDGSCGNAGTFQFVLPETSPNCTLSSPSKARCVLDASGSMSITVETGQPGGSPDRCVLTARSGRKVALAVLGVEQSLSDVSLELEFSPTSLDGCQAEQSCVPSIRPPLNGVCPATHLACNTLPQEVSLVASTQRGGAILATGTSKKLDLSVVSLTSGAPPLSFTSDGIPLPADGVDISRGMATLSVTTDGRGGTYRIKGLLDGLSASSELKFPNVPAGISVLRVTDGYTVKVENCQGLGVPGVMVSVSADGLTYTTPMATSAVGTVSILSQLPDDLNALIVQLADLGTECTSTIK